MESDLLNKSQQYFELMKTDEDLEKFMKLNSTSIRLINKLIRKEKAAGTLGRRLQLENRLCTLKGLSAKAKHRRHRLCRSTTSPAAAAARIGRGSAGRGKRSSRVRWVELENAFQCRIRTGAVVNLEHKFAEEFLDDAFILLKSRLVNALRKKKTNLKVNVELSADFELSRTGEIEAKYFATPNAALTPTSNLDEVMDNFKEVIMTKV